MKSLSLILVVVSAGIGSIVIGCGHPKAKLELVVLDNLAPSLYVTKAGDKITWSKSTQFTINFIDYSPCVEGLTLGPGDNKENTLTCTIKSPIEDGIYYAYTINPYPQGDRQSKGRLSPPHPSPLYVQSGGCGGCPSPVKKGINPALSVDLVNVSCLNGTGSVTADSNPTLSLPVTVEWIPLGPHNNVSFGAAFDQPGSPSPCNEGPGTVQSPLTICTIPDGAKPQKYNYTVVRSDCSTKTGPAWVKVP
jgi:hypothetical protein